MQEWIRRHRIGLSLIPVLLVMGMIYWFSAQNGEESGALSSGLTAWVLGLVVPGFGEFSPEKQQAIFDGVGLFIRKAGHFSEFALLGFVTMLHIRQIGTRISIRFPWLWAFGVGAAYAASDEFHQSFVGGRYPAVTDVLIDCAGVAAGTALLCLIFWRKAGKRCCFSAENT